MKLNPLWLVSFVELEAAVTPANPPHPPLLLLLLLEELGSERLFVARQTAFGGCLKNTLCRHFHLLPGVKKAKGTSPGAPELYNP